VQRRILLAGNWKLNKNRAEAASFFEEVALFLDQQVGREKFSANCGKHGKPIELAVLPPITLVDSITKPALGLGISLGVQNFYHLPNGAYTGEISLSQVADLQVDYVLVGHSERRQIFGEDDEIVGAKVRAALASPYTTILCVGEPLAARQEHEHKDYVLDQLERDLAGVDDLSRLIIAYEPIWAIGTGVNAEPADAAEMQLAVRNWLRINRPAYSESVLILYGGSVKPENIAPYIADAGCDGALVGGASLSAASFVGMLSALIGVVEGRAHGGG
jgi:triosephosphate isomerase